MKLIQTIVLLVLLTLANQSLAENKAIPKLYKDQGYLLLDLQIERPVAEITVEQVSNKPRSRSKSHKKTFKKHPLGSSLRIFSLPAGKYRLAQIVVPHFDLPSRLDINERENSEFEIAAQKVNYIGKIIVDKDRGQNWISVNLLNRLAERLPEINKDYSAILARYPLVFSGSKQDDFLQLVQSAQVNKEVK